MTDLPVLLTPAQVSDVLQLSRSRIYELMGSGVIPSVTIGRSRRVPATRLEEFVESLYEVGS